MEINSQEEIEKNLKIVAGSSIIVFIGIIISKIFSYLYIIFIGRNLGPEIYGRFSLATIIVGWLIAVACLGFTDGIVRFISFYRGKKQNNKINFLFKFSFLSILSSTLIVASLSFIFSDFISISLFHDAELSIYLKILSVFLPVWALSLFSFSVLRAFEKIKTLSIIERIIQNTSKLLFLLLLVFLGLKSSAVIFSFATGILISFILAFSYIRINLGSLFKKYSLSKKVKKILLKEFISYSWPVLFFSIVYSTFYWTDSFFIGFYYSSTEVGIYNVIIPIAILLYIVPELFLQIFFPLITKEYSKNKIDLIEDISKQVSKWIFILNLPIFIIFFLFPDVIINILFGSTYLVAGLSLRFLLVSGFVSSLLFVSNNLLSMVGKSKTILFDMAIATILNITLNYFLTPSSTFLGIENSLGINGAAFATMISVLFFDVLIFFHAKSATSIIPLRRKMFRVIISSVIPILFLLFVKKYIEPEFISMILLTITFFLIYFVCLFLFRAFDKNDFMILNIFRNKFYPNFGFLQTH